MTTIVTRAGKGSPLTNTEMDNNLNNLNTDKLEKTNNLSDVSSASTARTNLGLGTAAVQNVGTSAGDVVQVQTGGKLPALDGSQLTGIGSASEQALTGFYAPTMDGGYRDMYRSGFLPAWFNQQWGGSQWGNLPDGSFGSVATGSIDDNAYSGIGSAAGQASVSAGFKVSETILNPIVWLKLYKVGNPSYNPSVLIYSDNGSGTPNTSVATGGTILPRQITSKSDGEWYAFQLTGTINANTQYHVVVLAGTVDASNYYVWKAANSKKYPHGFLNIGTSAPVWTPAVTVAQCFLIQNPAANALIQAGGMFDAKLCFNQGTPVDQSRAVAQPLVNFYDGRNCTMLYRGTYAASSNVLDLAYGIDHDRITLTVNSSGYPVLTIYRSDRTAYTVTGTGSVTSGNHDVGFKIRTVGDGADYATLYVDGVSVGTPLTAQTFTMDKALRDLGTMRLGDGFGLAPTWTQDMQMTSLPSAQGWTWTGTGTEANCMSVQGGKLYQNANGYGSTQSGYYAKTTAFSNATGWSVEAKMRVPSSTNSAGYSPVGLNVDDGAKTVLVAFHMYFAAVYLTNGAVADFYIQGDFSSQEHVFLLNGKGSDFYMYVDGKLVLDGTGKMTSVSALNVIKFGDLSITSGENADAIWSYVKYYQGGMILPIANSGTCSEFAHWSGDRSALLPTLYNSGTPKSVKEVCGVPRNYQYEAVVQREVRRGVTSSPTTTSTTPVSIPDLNAFVIGNAIAVGGIIYWYNSGTYHSYVSYFNDGVKVNAIGGITSHAGNFVTCTLPQQNCSVALGLHKVELRYYVNNGTLTIGGTSGTDHQMTIEARS